MLEMISKLLMTEQIEKLNSKLCGKENYCIDLKDNKVIFYGTKGQWKTRNHTYFLKEAYRYRTYKFTYKKDFIAVLKSLGIEI